MEREGRNVLLFWAIYCLFTAPDNPENQNFEKMRKNPGDIITLHLPSTMGLLL